MQYIATYCRTHKSNVTVTQSIVTQSIAICTNHTVDYICCKYVATYLRIHKSNPVTQSIVTQANVICASLPNMLQYVATYGRIHRSNVPVTQFVLTQSIVARTNHSLLYMLQMCCNISSNSQVAHGVEWYACITQSIVHVENMLQICCNYVANMLQICCKYVANMLHICCII